VRSELSYVLRALVDAALQGRDEWVAGVKAELLRLEREAAHLVGFLKAGRSSPTIWTELEATETAIGALRAELAALEPQDPAPVPRVHPEWVRAKARELDAVVHEDPVRARLEIMKHLEGDLENPAPPGRGGSAARGDQRAGETKQPPRRGGGCFPALGCGGWICRVLHDSGNVLD
jgi:hypothetical protein